MGAALGAPVPQAVQKSSAQASATPLSYPPLFVKDIFGRKLNSRGITLVDWDGHLANPAIELRLVPPWNAGYPYFPIALPVTRTTG